MKILYRKSWMGKRGVSPVIATILMVAITVVLAAVLYVMVSGYMQGGSTTPVSGALTYDMGLSNANQGEATFQFAISNPANTLYSEIAIKILDPDGNLTNDLNYTWQHLASDSVHVATGDRLVITHPAGDSVRRYEVVVTVTGYTGVIAGTVPA
ncbi:MAG: type IV pilin N-terminal domain-containing protein [Methanobacteriota archaeon]